MQALGAYSYAQKTLLEGDQPQRIVGWGVTASLFSVLQIPPQLGRTISPEDEASGASVIVLSNALWVNQFGADSSVLGMAQPRPLRRCSEVDAVEKCGSNSS